MLSSVNAKPSSSSDSMRPPFSTAPFAGAAPAGSPRSAARRAPCSSRR